jgi:RHS repeat-associated protein
MSEDYDARGFPVRSKTPGVSTDGKTPYLFTESGYDWAGRRIFLSDAHAETEAPVWSWFDYDLRGRAITSGSALGEKHFKYSSFATLGDGFPEWTFPDSIELTHITDENGKQAVAIGDHNGALVASANGVDLDAGDAGFVSRTVRGALDLPTKLIDPELHETSTEYDADGLVAWSEDVNRGKTQFFYDAYGNVKRTIAADDVESEFHYDRINRVTSRADNGEAPSEWWYDHDALGHPKPGRLTEMVGPTGIHTVFGYEDSPRALGTSVARRMGSETFTTTTEYDALGHPIRIEYPKVPGPSGDFTFAVRPAFDEHSGQMVATQSDDETTNYWKITDADTRGRVTEVTLGNGVRESYGFDPTSQLLSSLRVVDQANNELGSLGYSYYANGQIMERDLSGGGVTRTRTITYDSARRIESVTETGPGALDEEFGFSPSGRLESRTKFGAYTPDAQRPLAVGLVAGNEFSYDDRGNQKTRSGPNIPGGIQTLSYNRFNLPSQVLFGDPTNPDRTVTYEYDALGTRLVKRETNDGPEVLSLGDEFERTTMGGGSSAVQDKFRIFAVDGEIAQLVYNEETGSSELQYLHRDRQRSVLFTTDGAGQASELRDFDLFGEPVATPSWATTTNEAFTGHRNDADTGLVDAGARLYDAAFGVFVSADPLRISGPGSQGFNPYAYANNDPVNLFDPTGLQAADDDETVIYVYGCKTNPSGPTCGGNRDNTSLGDIYDFRSQEGTLSQAELDRIPSGYQAQTVGTPLTQPEFQVRDTSEFWHTAMNIVVASYNLLGAAERLAGYLATRAFIANAARLGLNAEAKGVCAGGLCPCFVAGTFVDTDSGGKPIEQVELGDRIGPELELCAATNFAQWREVDLVMSVDNNGTFDELELRLLRPDAWIREQGMLEGRLFNVTLDDLNVSGPARVRRLGISGQVAAGKRCPVTGWVRHTSHDVIALTLEGNETLEVTRHHRLFSADRGTWVHAGDVQDGEALQTQDGVVHAKHAGTERLAAVEVFNLEVFGAHQYFVGGHRVLAHNVYGGAGERGLTAADLGLSGKGITNLTGTVVNAGTTRIINVANITATRGALVSELRGALPNILNTARAEGVQTLQISASFANAGLAEFSASQAAQFGGTFSSGAGVETLTFILKVP